MIRFLIVLTFACLAAAPLPAGTGFDSVPGWPIQVSGSSPDGGLLVNLDEDPELEVVRVVGSAALGCEVYAHNPDGSTVPGWPVNLGFGPFAPPAFGDVDGDGEGEIVVHTTLFTIDGQVWALNTDGSTVPGFPLTTIGGPVKGPALGDLDGDGDLEILSVTNSGGLGSLWAIDGDGSIFPGWPQIFDSVGGSAAAVGDVDGDGVPEIFVPSFYRLYGFSPDGLPLAGFPFEPGPDQTFNWNTPILADLEGDGTREILIASTSEVDFTGRVHVIDTAGDWESGWPQETPYSIFIPVSVADLTGNGELDVVVGDRTLSPDPVNSLFAWDRQGNSLPGFPVGGLEAMHAQIMIADIDGDGSVELLFDGNTGLSGLFAYETDGNPVVDWPLALTGSSFQQSPVIGDYNQDGFMDIAGGGNLIADNETWMNLWTSSFPWDEALAPVAMYQFNPRRDGAFGVLAPSSSVEIIRGDVDGNGVTNPLVDAIYFLNWGFSGTAEPPCLAQADTDGNVNVNPLVDTVYLLTWGFAAGSPPPAPGPDACGADLVGVDALGCLTPTCP